MTIGSYFKNNNSLKVCSYSLISLNFLSQIFGTVLQISNKYNLQVFLLLLRYTFVLKFIKILLNRERLVLNIHPNQDNPWSTKIKEQNGRRGSGRASHPAALGLNLGTTDFVMKIRMLWPEQGVAYAVQRLDPINPYKFWISTRKVSTTAQVSSRRLLSLLQYILSQGHYLGLR